MKNILLILLFVSGFAHGQIVNIPDANFKAKLLSSLPSNSVAGDLVLNFFKIDSNSDNQIQVSEALQVGYIDVSNSSIIDLTGIEQFVNLQTLICNNNQIANINLSLFTNLNKLVCNNNLLSSIDFSGLVNLQIVNCSYNSLTILNASNFNHITILDCSYNQISNLNINGLTSLTDFNCQGNQLLNLNLFGLTNLKFIYCDGNQLTTLDLSGLLVLQELYCGHNQISTLNLLGLNNLNKLDISYNLFSNINLIGLTNLQRLGCNNNSITDLNFNGLINLQFLNCSHNLLQTLDLNQQSNLQQLYCYNNLLTSLFIKNGVNESLLSFYNNLNLQFICADDTQISSIQNQLISLSMTATVSNNYCSFTPGGNYNTITGTIKYDLDNNGCDPSDPPQANIRANIDDGTTQGATFTNATGNYNFYTPAGSFNVNLDIENPTWFTIAPNTATIPFANNNNNTTTQDFCIAPNGIHNDLEVELASIIPARPGFDATYKIVYKNKGNQTLSGTIGLVLNYDSSKMTFVASSQLPTTANAGVLDFGYSINPFESKSIDLTFHINAPTDASPTNVGDVLNFITSITPTVTDENPADNLFTYNQTVVGSYDPNSIECLEGASVDPSLIGTYLHYDINFENDGTSEAQNIVVKDTIDTTQYDINSLQILNTSNPAYIKITGNILEIIFKDIHLPPHSTTPPVGGHGNVLFKIKSLNTLVANDFVSKTAQIYFDYNAPVATNIAQTVFEALSNQVFIKDDSVTVSPNPSSSIINIKCSSTIKSIELFDVQGRILETALETKNTTLLDISDKQNGIYFLKITTEKGSKVEKVVKE